MRVACWGHFHKWWCLKHGDGKSDSKEHNLRLLGQPFEGTETLRAPGVACALSSDRELNHLMSESGLPGTALSLFPGMRTRAFTDALSAYCVPSIVVSALQLL